MTRAGRLLAITISLPLIAAASLATAQRQQPERAITNITGDLYRFQNGSHFSVFLVTSDGVIATDPINRPAAEWLKGQIAERFGQPVKYVIYSHHHGDHVSGGEVFADTATFIGHENMLPALKVPAEAPLAGRARAMDVDGNGAVERAEARGFVQANFDNFDADGNGAVTGVEMAAAGIRGIRKPDTVYTDTMNVTLGGKTVELHYVGRNHSDNMTVLRFPEERTMFTVDFITVKRLPFRNLGDSYLADWITSIKRVQEMEFDIVTPGHGPLGTRADVADNLAYLEDLTAAVQAQLDAGATVEQAQAAVTLDAYKDWGQYEAWRAENVAGAYRILSAAN